MFKVVFLCSSLGLLLLKSPLFAFDIGNQKIEVGLANTYVSRYIWRGQDLFGDNDGANQPSLNATLKDFLFGTDASLNLWGSLPVNAGHEDAEELDYTFSFSRDILRDKLNLSGGYTYFDFPNTASTSDVQEPWISVALKRIPALPGNISAEIFAGYDFKARSGGPDEGWYYSWGLGSDFSLPKCSLTQDGQALHVSLTNWGNDGVANLKPSFLYATELSCSVSYVFAVFSITPSFNYCINHESEINNGDDEVWVGLEIKHPF